MGTEKLMKKQAFYVLENESVHHLKDLEWWIKENEIRLSFNTEGGKNSVARLNKVENEYVGNCKSDEGEYEIKLRLFEDNQTLILTGEWIMYEDAGLLYIEFRKVT